MTYEEVGEAVGFPAVSLGRYLEGVYHACVERGLPWLNVLVVNKSTRRPGHGWQGTWNASGVLIDPELVWRMAVAQVMAYPGWATATYEEVSAHRLTGHHLSRQGGGPRSLARRRKMAGDPGVIPTAGTVAEILD